VIFALKIELLIFHVNLSFELKIKKSYFPIPPYTEKKNCNRKQEKSNLENQKANQKNRECIIF